MASQKSKTNHSVAPIATDRVQTRAKNATTHPDRVVNDVLAVRRRPEEINAEKAVRTERRQARKQKEADLHAAVLEVTEYENKMALEDAEKVAKLPRCKHKGPLDENPVKDVGKKRKQTTATLSVQLEVPVVGRSKTTAKCQEPLAIPADKLDLNMDGNSFKAVDKKRNRKATTTLPVVSRDKGTPFLFQATGLDVLAESEVSEIDERDLKRLKRTAGNSNQRFRNRSLHRTETYLIVSDGSDVEMQDPIIVGSDSEIEIDTPKPKKRGWSENEAEDLPYADVDDFKTPTMLEKASKTKAQLLTDGSDSDSDEVDKRFKRASQIRAQLLAAGSDIDSMDENAYQDRTYTTSEDSHNSNDDQTRKKRKKKDNTKSKDLRESDSTQIGKEIKKKDDTESEDAHESDSTQTGKGNRNAETKKKKNRKAFRMEVEKKRGQLPTTAQMSHTLHAQENRLAARRVNFKTINPQSGVYHKSVTSKAPQTQTQKGVSTLSRASATSGNNVGVSQTTSARGDPKKGMAESTTTSTTMAGGFSDEDDSIERASILNSPLKGEKQLSSIAVVKIEKPQSSMNKSRSKESILGREVVSGWSKSIEPMFVYHYYYEMSPWPTVEDIENGAQPIWDWRFGVKHPLAISKSPQHLQLLNQKLCDIRNQAASLAIGILDDEFHANHNTTGDITQMEIQVLREQYAKDYLDDKKFIFGKYVLTDGKVRKTLPYQSKLISRTFAHFFKHIKDVYCDENSPLASLKSCYPKTALAIATAAVERALTLCSNGDYDFVTGKLIPKPDPSHPKKRPSTNMFAFSENSWKPRVELYLEKGILNLKEKDWKNIMKAAAEHSNFVAPKSDPIANTQKALEPTEEELELTWDSDSGGED